MNVSYKHARCPYCEYSHENHNVLLDEVPELHAGQTRLLENIFIWKYENH